MTKSETKKKTIANVYSKALEEMTVLERMAFDEQCISKKLLKKIREGKTLKDDDISYIVEHIRGLDDDDYETFLEQYEETSLSEELKEKLSEWERTKDEVEDYIYYLEDKVEDKNFLTDYLKDRIQFILKYKVREEDKNDIDILIDRLIKEGLLNDPIFEFFQVRTSIDYHLSLPIVIKALKEVLAESFINQYITFHFPDENNTDTDEYDEDDYEDDEYDEDEGSEDEDDVLVHLA